MHSKPVYIVQRLLTWRVVDFSGTILLILIASKWIWENRGMKRLKSMVIVGFAMLIAIAGIAIAPVQSVSALSSASLSIVPKKNYTIEPGKSINDKLTIRNLDPSASLSLTLRVVDFTFNDDGGTPKLMLASDAPQTTWSLKPFLKLPEIVTVGPNSSKSVDMSVAIPAGHGAGSYYSAIVYSSGAPTDGGNVGLSASGVTLVFASIPGKVNESLSLQQFGVYKQPASNKPGTYASFTTDMPEQIAYTLKNDGNVTESPVGSITLKSMYGQTQVISDVNPNKSLALIGQTRTFTSCIQQKVQEVDLNGSKSKSVACTTPWLWPGHYNATLDVFYGQNGNNTQEIVKTIGFWYMPWWATFVLIIVLLAIAITAWRVTNAVRTRLNGGVKFNRTSRRK